MLLTTAPHQRPLVSLALILLLLLSPVVAASEVAEHALCNQGVELMLAEPSSPAGIEAGSRGSDHATHPHLCHVHPPAHSLPAGVLAAPTDRSTQVFPPVLVALSDVATAPPVPPPNA